MATKLLPAHFAALLPGVIGYTCRCGADDWTVASVKSRPSPEGYVRLRCKECAREASTATRDLSDNVKAKRLGRYYGRMAESHALQLRRWVAVLEASIASGEFSHVGHLQSLLTSSLEALATPVEVRALADSAQMLEQAEVFIGHNYSTAVVSAYTGPLPWQDVVAAAHVLNAEERYPDLGPLTISYEGVWDPSTKRLRPFQTPSWMPTPATFNQGDKS